MADIRITLQELKILSVLVAGRDSNKMATSLTLSQSDLPEPLIAIWEPHGLASAKTYLKRTLGSSPRKFLMDNDVKLVAALDDDALFNANSPEEFEIAKQRIP